MKVKYCIFTSDESLINNIHDTLHGYCSVNPKLCYLYKKLLYKYDELEDKDYNLQGSIEFIKNIEYNKEKSIYSFVFEIETTSLESCKLFLSDWFTIMNFTSTKITYQIEIL